MASRYEASYEEVAIGERGDPCRDRTRHGWVLVGISRTFIATQLKGCHGVGREVVDREVFLPIKIDDLHSWAEQAEQISPVVKSAGADHQLCAYIRAYISDWQGDPPD